MLRLLTMALAVVASLGFTGCGPDMATLNAFCERAKRCDLIPDEDSAVRVCATVHAGVVRTYLANSERECLDLASASQALWACEAKTECDATDTCETERNAARKALDDAGELCDAK